MDRPRILVHLLMEVLSDWTHERGQETLMILLLYDMMALV
jgi:hypothetical protein